MKRTVMCLSIVLSVFSLCGCSENGDSAGHATAGKCGAALSNGNDALMKKKAIMLSMIQKGDPRRKCVFKAQSSESLYDCIRDPETGKLTMRCDEMREQRR